MPEEPKRYREVRATPQPGRNQALHEYRVVETLGEIPSGCEPTTEEPCEWVKES